MKHFKMRKNFTFIELIIALVIVSVLATLAVSHMAVMREKTFGREAASQIKVIQTALETVSLEDNSNTYVTCANTAVCNNALRLTLSGNNWVYSVAGGAGVYTITATRQGGSSWTGCTYTMDQTQTQPVNVNCQQ